MNKVGIVSLISISSDAEHFHRLIDCRIFVLRDFRWPITSSDLPACHPLCMFAISELFPLLLVEKLL
jgi:hypothetical protein